MKPLNYHLNFLMATGREYTIAELYSLTGEQWRKGGMQEQSFKRRLRENPLYEKYYNEQRELWLWKCTHVLMPAPCNIRKRFKSWITSIVSF